MSLHLIPVSCATSTKAILARPILTLDASTSSVVYLGDNDTTGIMDPNLSTNVLKVYEKGGKVYAFCCTGSVGMITLNGVLLDKGARRELHAGDVVILRSGNGTSDDDGEYIYRVVNPDDDEKNNNNNDGAAAVVEASSQEAVSDGEAMPAAPAAVAGTAQAQQPFSAQVSENAMCSICLEIMIEPQTVVPCGHSFCKGCLEQQQSECAECRGPIQGQIICRSLTNMITDLVDVAKDQPNLGIFDKEDLESYLSRKTQATRASASRATITSARKRRRVLRRNLASAGTSAENVIEL